MNTLVPNIISLSQVKERRELCLVSATKTNRQNQTVLPRVLSLRRPLGKMHDGAGTSALREWLPSPSVSGNAPSRCPSVSSRISAASACTDPWAEEPQRTSRLNGPPAWKLQLFDAVVLGAGGQERDFCSTSATKLPAPSSQQTNLKKRSFLLASRFDCNKQRQLPSYCFSTRSLREHDCLALWMLA